MDEPKQFASREELIKDLRRRGKYETLTDEQILYFTDPDRLKAQQGLSLEEKIAEFWNSPIGWVSDKFKVHMKVSILIGLYKEFGIEHE